MFIGLQLYSLRDALAADFEGTLKAVHEMGYDSVEFAGIYGKTAEEVKALCAKYELTPISAHVSIAEMESDPDVFNKYKAIGCKYIAMPYLPDELRPKNGNADELIEMATKLCKLAKDAGLQMLYHNHDFEFTRLDNGEYYLDELYARIPADLLETELDTCWVNVAGENPCEYLNKYSGRAHVVHLKDFFKKGANVEGMYELIGIKSVKPAAADETFGFRPVGHGMQNMPAIIEAAKKAGAEYLIVEQDRPTPGKEPMDEVKLSREYLKSIGY